MAATNKTILVTGASGYVAAHIIAAFLKAGYRVRGTVRSESSIPKIIEAQGDLSKNLEFAIVKDITTPGAFDDAVKGVTGVMATASPFDLKTTDLENDLLKPAIAGVLRLLESAKNFGGSQLERVVLTASFASNLDMSKGYRPGYTYTEEDWNPATFEEAASSGSTPFAYCASKGLAEKAGWNW
jgi:nucleoside-diphosphate-sugar epimerase